MDRTSGAEVLVVLGGEEEVHRVSGPAALVWEALAEPSTRADLVANLEPLAPAGTDVSEVVRRGVDLLLAASLIEVVSG